MNSRYVYVNSGIELITEFSEEKRLYLYDKATGRKISFTLAGTYVHNVGYNANFFLPLLSPEQLEVIYRPHSNRHSLDNITIQEKLSMLEPIYRQAGVTMGHGDFPTVSDPEQLVKLVRYCVSRAANVPLKRSVKTIGKYRITKR